MPTSYILGSIRNELICVFAFNRQSSIVHRIADRRVQQYLWLQIAEQGTATFIKH